MLQRSKVCCERIWCLYTFITCLITLSPVIIVLVLLKRGNDAVQQGQLLLRSIAP